MSSEAQNRLDQFNADRSRLLGLVEERVVGRLVAAAGRGGESSLEYVLNDVCISEIKRLEVNPKANRRALERWHGLASRLLRMDEGEKQQELAELTRYYGHDIVGSFDPRVYRFAKDVLPRALGVVFSPIRGIRDGVEALRQLDGRVRVEGALDLVRTMAARGTVVVTPTHSSNMDSVVIGFALQLAGLPPVTYGAGKNLFTNPFISFFMRNLGAYRVDRRLRFQLYKDVLKEYSTVLLENGYHSLFFPGGTRCRSNVVERHLKLGLLGTTVTAYRNSVRAGEADRRIYIVPATINYRLVLEAETLINDYLAEKGKSRFIITDDEFSRFGRIVEFIRKMLVQDGALVVRLGRPLDPFGNDVDDQGASLDRAGRVVDPASYVRGAGGEVTDDDQRDAEYTRMLGARLAEAFPRETVFHSTHLVARVLYDALCRRAATKDIYRLLRASDEVRTVPVAAALAALGSLCERIRAEPQVGRLHPQIEVGDLDGVLADAVRGLGTYHSRPVVEQRGDDIVTTDIKLLYYYRNRTDHIAGVS